MNGGFVKFIFLIVVILGIAFLSQQPFLESFGKSAYSRTSEVGVKYWLEAKSWFGANVYPRISGEVAKRQDIANKEIITQKNNLVRDLWEKCKDFFTANISKIFQTKED